MILKSKTISVIGLGHVGLSMTVHYHKQGYRIKGVDINKKLINNLNRGITSQLEPGVNSKTLNKIHFQTDYPDSDIYIICIDVPEKKGKYNPKNLLNTINKILKIKNNKLIIIRSTIDYNVVLFLKKKLKNKNFATILFSPEFLREGCALHDLANNPNYYGVLHKGCKNKISLPIKIHSKLYDCKLLTFLKITCNAWRATKVSFANMLMQISNENSFNYKTFYELFVADELNISKAYMKGGAPYGGYCLPKETRILSHYEKLIGSNLLSEVMRINEKMIFFWTKKIINRKPKRVIFESLSFKPGINDKRNSPLFTIYNKLNYLGYNLKVIGDNFKFTDLKKDDLLVTNNELKKYKNVCEIINIASD